MMMIVVVVSAQCSMTASFVSFKNAFYDHFFTGGNMFCPCSTSSSSAGRNTCYCVNN